MVFLMCCEGDVHVCDVVAFVAGVGVGALVAVMCVSWVRRGGVFCVGFSLGGECRALE